MNSPYIGKFRVSQQYKGATHDGLDLVGISNKEIHCVAEGKVIKAGWESTNNKKQGFGQYVKVETADKDVWYYGHLSKISVKLGQALNVGDTIGIEGSTGKSTGSHLHICVRKNGVKGAHKDVSVILDIPNKKGTYSDTIKTAAPPVSTPQTVTAYIIATVLNVRSAPSLNASCVTKLRAGQSIVYSMGSETSADGYTWVSTVMDDRLVWVAKNYLVAVGDSVKVKPNAADYNGKRLASFVYKNTYTLMSISGTRAVIGIKGQVTAAVRVSNLCR